MVKHYSKHIHYYAKHLLTSICLLIFVLSANSQSFGIVSLDSSTTAHYNPVNDSAFFARVSSDPGNNGGYFDSLQRTIITCEAETLRLTNDLITQFSGSSGASYTQYGGALQAGEYVNVYLVYLNDTADWRADSSVINFDHEILGVYAGWDQTLYFDSSSVEWLHRKTSRFQSRHY